jgi:hypothetical protein
MDPQTPGQFDQRLAFMRSLVILSDSCWSIPSAVIMVTVPLFTLLEDDIQLDSANNNWLMFAGNPFEDQSMVTVTHFGPLGFKNQKETEGNFAKVKRILMEYLKSDGLIPQSQIDLKDYSKTKVHKFSVSNLVFKDY